MAAVEHLARVLMDLILVRLHPEWSVSSGAVGSPAPSPPDWMAIGGPLETSHPLVAYSPSTPAPVQPPRAHELDPQSRKSGWILVPAPRTGRPAAPHLHPQQTLRARQR